MPPWAVRARESTDEAQVGKRGCGVGRTALHWAARNGHEHVARFLVAERGACPNVATSDGETCQSRSPFHPPYR